MVRDDLRLQVIVLNPTAHFSIEMQRAATAYREISEASLKAAQFSEELTDSHGTFHRPEGWETPKPRRR